MSYISRNSTRNGRVQSAHANIGLIVQDFTSGRQPSSNDGFSGLSLVANQMKPPDYERQYFEMAEKYKNLEAKYHNVVAENNHLKRLLGKIQTSSPSASMIQPRRASAISAAARVDIFAYPLPVASLPFAPLPVAPLPVAPLPVAPLPVAPLSFAPLPVSPVHVTGPPHVSALPPVAPRVDALPTHNQFTGKPLYQGRRPGGSDRDWSEWFNSPQGYEYPHQTRGHYKIKMSNSYLDMRVAELNCVMERLVVHRALPSLNKEVGAKNKFDVASMTKDVWVHWTNSHKYAPTSTRSKPWKSVDHGVQKRAEETQILEWSGGSYPTLHTEHWWMKKWLVPETGIIYRALVKSIKFYRNRWTCLVRVQFSYDTWYYDVDEREWFFTS